MNDSLDLLEKQNNKINKEEAYLKIKEAKTYVSSQE